MKRTSATAASKLINSGNNNSKMQASSDDSICLQTGPSSTETGTVDGCDVVEVQQGRTAEHMVSCLTRYGTESVSK